MSIEVASPPTSPHRATNKVNSEISVPFNEREDKVTGEVQRSQWGNQFQFILSAVGLAVGLGNIWRFPYVAYENGGAAFLIPYLCCGLTFGLPMVYAEFMMGQYSRSGPGLVIGRYAAGFRGVGWCMTVNAISVAIYYCVIIAWAGVYLAWVFSGQSWKWTECGNWWNTARCFSQSSNLAYCGNIPQRPFYFNGTCNYIHNPSAKQAAEEFFTNYITARSNGITDIQGFNWPVLGALVFLWIITALILIKGITIMGYLSYVIVPFPYIIVCILFVRGVTLKGAWLGIQYYLFKPDFSKLLHGDTWAAALKQLMFSMSIGYGGLISLSSYSKPSNNFFRDSLIVIFGDTLMSLIGGVASFSILGYLATLTNQTIDKVVSSGTALAFIVYPEAISMMSVPWLWNALFFLMLFFLGITSEIALVEVFTGMINDCFPSTKKRKWLITLLTCGGCQLAALLMVTYAGWYWFALFEEFTGSTCACVVAASEIGILSFYGWRQIKVDLIEMRGEPRYGGWKRWIGPRSPLYGIFWATVCPILAVVIAVLQLRRSIPFSIKMDDSRIYVFPVLAEIFGWFLDLGALIPIPAFFIYKWIQFRKRGIPFHYLFRPSKDLPSYDRYYKDHEMPDPEEMALRSTAVVRIPSSSGRNLSE